MRCSRSHEYAELRAQGWKIAAIAAKFGVTDAAVSLGLKYRNNSEYREQQAQKARAQHARKKAVRQSAGASP